MRRERDNDGEADGETEKPNNAAVAQQQQVVPTPDRVEVLFNALCSTFTENLMADQTAASASASLLSVKEQKELLRLFREFLAGANNPARFDAGGGGGACAAPSTATEAAAADPDTAVRLRFAALDDALQAARTFLRGAVLKQLAERSRKHSCGADGSAMLLSVAQSSSGTTAADDSCQSAAAGVQSTKPSSSSVAAVPTFEADAFLFDDEDIDDFEDKGWLSRNFCANCGRADAILKSSFISHSFPVASLKFMCHSMLERALSHAASSSPSSEFVAVDVGSRLGVVPVAMSQWLVSASAPVSVYGVEFDGAFCALQNRLLKCKAMCKRKLTASVKIVETDVTKPAGVDILRRANFVVMNNVFEFFASEPAASAATLAEKDEQDPEAPTLELRSWRTVLSSMPRGCHLVAIPGLEASLSAARQRAGVANGSASPQWQTRWERIAIPKDEMQRIARMCVVEDNAGDDSDCDDHHHEHHHHHHHDHDEDSGCSAGKAKGANEVAELIEDFEEIALYVAKE